MSSLTPVYHQLKSDPDDVNEIPLDDFTEQSPSLETSPSKDTCPSHAKCCSDKDGRASIVHRCCRGLAVLCCVGLALHILIGVTALVYVGAQTHRCLHPNHRETIVYNFAPGAVEGIHVELVSGRVKVRASPEVEEIEVRLTKAAHSDELLMYMVPHALMEEKKFHLRVDSPSFDWHHCQIATVEVVVPESMTYVTSNIDLAFSVILGSVEVAFHDERTFKSIDAHADVGLVYGRNFHASETFSASVGLGGLRLKDFHAPSITANVDVGFIHARHVESMDSSVALGIGFANLGHWSTYSLNLIANIGYVHMGEFYHTKIVKAHVAYGKLRFVPETWQGTFTLESPYGYLSFDNGEQIPDPVFEQNDMAKMTGYLTLVPEADGSKPATFENDLQLSSIYGAVSVFVPNTPNKHFYERHAHKKYPNK